MSDIIHMAPRDTALKKKFILYYNSHDTIV